MDKNGLPPGVMDDCAGNFAWYAHQQEKGVSNSAPANTKPAEGTCLMTGRGHIMPCSAAGCPLFGDCLTRYEKELQNAAKQAASPDEKARPMDLHLLTISQLAEHIASQLDYAQIWKSKFPNCDFAIVEVQQNKQYGQEELECLHSGASGWYGIRSVNFGFDSSTLFAVADIYGGGCDQVCRLDDGIGVIEAEILLQEAIKNALECCETVLEDTFLIVEFLDKEETGNAE